MKFKLLLLSLFCLVCITAKSQVEITVPVSGDTVVCNGEPVTLHALNSGYVSHSVSLSVDDDYSSLKPIGFTFKFYGNSYTNMVISSNGFVSFNSADASGFSDWSITTGIPGNPNCKNSVMGAYSDIYIPAGGTVTYGVAGVAPYRKCVINFCKCYMFECTTIYCTFQIILYETTNVAEVHMGHKATCTTWNSGAAIEGVENSTGTVATVAPGRNYPGTWSVTVPDGRRFTPNLTGTSYTCDTIPYAPIPDSTSPIYWYSGTTYEGIGPTITVNPTVPTTYEAWAISCGDTSKAYATVTIGTGPSISGFNTANPSVCGFCDGSITLHGIIPGLSDTVNYQFNGIAQPYVVATAGIDSTITITGLCAGAYDNFTVKQGYCISNPAGPVSLFNPPIAISGFSSTPPSICGACDATITLSGLYPGASDTINYTKDGVVQPYVVAIVAADGTVTLTGLCSGIYTNITATMSVCTSPTVGPIDIVDPPFFISGTASTNPSVCGAHDGTLTLYGLVPGTTVAINYSIGSVAEPPVIQVVTAGGSVTLTGLDSGTYNNITVTMTTCTTPAVGPVVLANPAFVITDTLSMNAGCALCNGSITLLGLTAGEPITVSYNFDGVPQAPYGTTSSGTGSVTVPNLCAGAYSNVTATLNTCVTAPVGVFNIVQPPLVDITYTASSNPSECGKCDGNISITGVSPYTLDSAFYTYTTPGGTPVAVGPVLVSANGAGTITLLNLCEGAYTNFFIKQGICPTDTINTNVVLTAPTMTAAFDTIIHRGCNGDTVFFTNHSMSPGVLYYTWGFGDGTSDTIANPTHVYQQGIYTATLTVTNGYCVQNATAQLNLVHTLQTAFSAASIVCQGTPVVFNDSTVSVFPATYSWSFGDGATDTAFNPTHTYYNTGTYTVQLIATNTIPCSDTATATVFVDSLSGISMTRTDSAICQGGNITFTGTYTGIGLTGVTWNFGDGETIGNVNPVAHAFSSVGDFIISLTASYRACPTVSVSKSVDVFAAPAINLGPDTAICPGSTAISLADNINGGNAFASWLWNTGQTTPAITVAEPGTYSVIVGLHGCYASDSVIVLNNCYMDMPNVFSPNGDGTNDYFYPRQFLTKGVTSFKMDIFDRWGTLIFEGTTIDGRGWDGKFNNIEQPNGVYIYIIDATFADGQREHHQGNVTLMR